MKPEKKSWMQTVFAYAGGEKKRMAWSVVLSVLSVLAGLVPFYCMYALICRFAARTATETAAVQWCLLALAAYLVKILLFSLSTGTSYAMAYTILEGLRLRLADRFLHAPLGDVENHSTAIVGPSGSGKTTICSLLARFYDPQGGSITLGGHDLREFTCDSLLANISMVFQNVYLFHDTIRANICFGKPDASEAEMIAAAKKARCHDFIIALPNGYDTVVGKGGGSLSGGEKQRISIARAILKDAPSSWTRPPPAWTRKTST